MRPSCITASGFGRAVKQLERDQPLEPRVPRAIDGAVRSAADDVQQIEMAPARAIGHQVRRRVGGDRQQLMQLAMAGGDLRDHRELVGDRAILVRRQRRGDRRPVDHARRRRCGRPRSSRLFVSHGASPPPAAPARGSPSCAPRRRWACPSLGDLGVRAAHLDARDHRFARFGVEPLERAVVLGERLGADRGFERRLALSPEWWNRAGRRGRAAPAGGSRRGCGS